MSVLKYWNGTNWVEAIVGAKGDTGATPTFTANATSLAAGATPTASVTGTTNNPVLNLGIPKGDKGDTGNAATIAVDPATITGAAGSNASVTNTGDQYNATFKFTIPRGNKGDTGTSITNVQRTSGTGAPGTTDTYTITFSDATTTTFPVYNGSDGRAISSIAKTSTVGLVDTYTVTYSDATTSTFTVTNGAKGDTGDFDGYGFGWAFSSNTNTTTAPSNGTFKLNNANSASATQIAISKVNSEGGTVNTNWFADLNANNNNKIIIREKTLPGIYIAYSINYATLTDYGTWITFDITNITRNGSITNGDPCWIVAALAGNDGATGPTGPGVPTLGNTGDLLIKTGSANYDTGWTTPSNTPANGVIPLYASSSYGSAGLRVGQGGIGIASQGGGNIQTILASGATGTFTLPSNANSVLAATTDRTAGITGNQTINTVYAAPSSGSAGLANFRSLVANDIPTLAQSKLTGVAIASWAPSTSYLRGDLVSYLGVVYRRISDGTSTSTFDPAMWQQQSLDADFYYTNYNDISVGTTASATAIPMFNKSITLNANMVYEVDLMWIQSFTLNTTAQTGRVNFAYTGTADATNPITWDFRLNSATAGTTSSSYDAAGFAFGGSTAIGPGYSASTSYNQRVFGKAIIRTGTGTGLLSANFFFGGTSGQLGVTAFATKSGSFMRVKPIAVNTGADYSQGVWA